MKLQQKEVKYPLDQDKSGGEIRPEIRRTTVAGDNMEKLLQDLKFAVRMLTRRPGFTVVAVIIMALGIGANTAIFTLVRAVLIRPLPFPDPDRLAMVWEDAAYIGFPHNTPAPANYADWKARNQVFENIAAIEHRTFNLTGDGEPEKVEAIQVTSSFFPTLGITPALGRGFYAEEDKPGSANVVVIGYNLWQRRYGGERDVLGREILLNDQKHLVIGVMPAGFQFLDPETAVWVPLRFTPQELQERDNHYLEVVARIKPDKTLDQAQADIKGITAQIAHDYPDEAGRIGANVVPLEEELAGKTRRPLIILLVAVAFVLLIASANLANLLLSRAMVRSKEIAVRSALGAARSRLVRQLLTESIVLSATGGAVGVIVALWSLSFLKQLIPPGLSLFTTLTIDPLVLGFTLVLSVATGVLFGLAPAIQTSRIDLNQALKQTGRTTLTAVSRRLQNVMVVGEIALAMILLIGAGLLIQTMARLRGQYAGLRAERVLTLRTQLPDSRYREPAKRIGFYTDVLEKVEGLPGITAAGYTTAVPLEWKGGTNGITIEGQTIEQAVIYDAIHRQVSADYFKAIGIEVKAGRGFNKGDNERSMPVAAINETMALQFFSGQNPLGKRFKHGGPDSNSPWMTIVGVVADLRQMGVEEPVKAEMYIPYQQTTNRPWFAPRDLVVRTTSDPMSLASVIRDKVHEVDPDQPVSNIRTMEDVLGREVSERRTGTQVLGTFAGLALLLAALGIYGVLSYFVTQRTPEFGLRMALGARRGDILRLVLVRGMGLAITGVSIGLVAGFVLTRLMQSLLFEVSASDPATFAGIAVTLIAVAFISCYVPARRATKVDPMDALRCE